MRKMFPIDNGIMSGKNLTSFITEIKMISKAFKMGMEFSLLGANGLSVLHQL